MPTKHEYAFDVHMRAVVRVTATSEKAAREAIGQVLDTCDVESLNAHAAKGVMLTEFSLESRWPNLFEKDGKYAASQHNCDHRETAGGICLDCGHDTVEDEEEESGN